MDKYLARLLWKWVQRRHSKTSRIVLFHQYWRKSEGRYVFCYLDPKIGRPYALLFHT